MGPATVVVTLIIGLCLITGGLALRSSRRTRRRAGVCVSCGQRNPSNAKFCARCGQPLENVKT